MSLHTHIEVDRSPGQVCLISITKVQQACTYFHRCHHLDICIGEQLEEPWLHVWLRVEGVRLLLDQSEVSIIASTNQSSPARPGPWTDSAASCPAAAASPWDSSGNLSSQRTFAKFSQCEVKAPTRAYSLLKAPNNQQVAYTDIC